MLPAERTFFRGAAGYEAARRKTVWNGLVPQRFPDAIVQACDTGDVVAALRHARSHGQQVGVCSGGRSRTASHLRDGGLLLDVGRLDHCILDTDRMIAHVGPGKVASEFALELDSEGLFFPAGHCAGIRLGGYLLQGGYGWNGNVLGPACESVLGLEVVTADGEQLYCDADNHPDLYWAARGSGPGFSRWSPRSPCGFTRARPWWARVCTCTRSTSPTRCSAGAARLVPRSTTGSNCKSSPRADCRRPVSTNRSSPSPRRSSPIRTRRRRKPLRSWAVARSPIGRSPAFPMPQRLWPTGMAP